MCCTIYNISHFIRYYYKYLQGILMKISLEFLVCIIHTSLSTENGRNTLFFEIKALEPGIHATNCVKELFPIY